MMNAVIAMYSTCYGAQRGRSKQILWKTGITTEEGIFEPQLKRWISWRKVMQVEGECNLYIKKKKKAHPCKST